MAAKLRPMKMNRISMKRLPFQRKSIYPLEITSTLSKCTNFIVIKNMINYARDKKTFSSVKLLNCIRKTSKQTC